MNQQLSTLADWLAEQPGDRVKIGVTDLDGILRTKYLAKAKVLAGLTDGLGFCNVIFGWDSSDTLYGNGVGDAGFADAPARYVPESRRLLPWEDNIPFLLVDFSETADAAVAGCPRSVLQRVVARAAALGYTAQFGPEYEWFVYRETPASLAERDYRQPTPLTPGMFGYSGLRTSLHAAYFRDLFEQLAAFGVPLEGLHTETGPGVMEAALLHQPALEAADRAMLFKQGVKEISYRHGYVASFMAKPFGELPGCGGHLHQSLWQAGKNIFYDVDQPDRLSRVGQHYLAGQLALLPVLLPLFAPTVNSYKRYVPGSWAATHANWGMDNRTVAIRALVGNAKSTRLELRIAGADANPYLVIAAALAAGLYGIEHELPLALAAVPGSAYDAPQGVPLSADLGAAIANMAADARPAELLGATFVEHFLRTRQWEWTQYQRAVTDWERRRYFESV